MIKMTFIVCCPTSLGGSTHMSFSRVFADFADAENYRVQLCACDPIKAPWLRPWGANSMLYDVQHKLYNNTRPPHVVTRTKHDIVVFLDRAYVYKMRLN